MIQFDKISRDVCIFVAFSEDESEPNSSLISLEKNY